MEGSDSYQSNTDIIHGQLTSKGIDVPLKRIERLADRIVNNGSNSEFSNPNSQDGFQVGKGGLASVPTTHRSPSKSPHARKVAAGIAPSSNVESTSQTSSAVGGTRKRKQANPKQQQPPVKAARRQPQQQSHVESGGESTLGKPGAVSPRSKQSDTPSSAGRKAKPQDNIKNYFTASSSSSSSSSVRQPPPTMQPSTSGSGGGGGGGGGAAAPAGPSQSPSSTRRSTPPKSGGGGGSAPSSTATASLQAQLSKLQTSLDLKEKRIRDMQTSAEQEKAAATGKSDAYKRALREILWTQVAAERRNARSSYLENIQRLGWVQSVRMGANRTCEQWNEGSAYTDLYERERGLEVNLKTAEEEIKRLSSEKKKRTAARKKADSSGNGGGGGGGAASEQSEDGEGFARPAVPLKGGYDVKHEIALLNRDRLKGDREALGQEKSRLEQAKLLHIREGKRLADESASTYAMGKDTLKGADKEKQGGRYLLMSLLGRGGFSEVFKAYDLEECRLAACKIHKVAQDWSEQKKDNYIKHATREYEIHSSLKHENVTALYDVFEIDDDTFCTVLEYCPGNDLDLMIKQSKTLSEKDAKAKIVQMVAALKYLNSEENLENPIIHYDLKPANVLLVDGVVKLTDFGLSKKMVEDDDRSTMELTSQGAGTYWYLPPECFRMPGKDGPPRISSKVDVWSVGVIFYQCLYGRKPFGNDQSQQSILQQQTILHARNVDFPENKKNGFKVSDEAKAFIRRCLTYEMHDRPDALELARDSYILNR